MKFIVGIDKYDYTFNPTSDQFTITGMTPSGGGLKVEQILLVTNITDNAIIYNFAAGNSNNGITAGSETSGNQTFTLGFDCAGAGMSASDKLQIIGQDASAPSYAIINDPFDKVDVTYISGGNGDGEIGTITYKLDTTTVATLTLTYDSDDRLENITRT